jgi:hypothetical protein
MMAQREEFRAKKTMSYMRNFATQEQIIAITDDRNALQQVKVSELYGEFDIEVNVVDEFEDSIAKKQAINEFLAIVGQSPEFIKHVDTNELLKEAAFAHKLRAERIVRPPVDADARSIARNENTTLLNGTAVRPQPNQNHDVHLTEHRSELLRWEGIPADTQSDPRVTNAQVLLKQHISETQLLTESEGATGEPLPQGQDNQTEGEAQGNQIAAAYGG